LGGKRGSVGGGGGVGGWGAHGGGCIGNPNEGMLCNSGGGGGEREVFWVREGEEVGAEYEWKG